MSYEDLYPLYKLADSPQFPSTEFEKNVIVTVYRKASLRLAAHCTSVLGQLLNSACNFIESSTKMKHLDTHSC